MNRMRRVTRQLRQTCCNCTQPLESKQCSQIRTCECDSKRASHQPQTIMHRVHPNGCAELILNRPKALNALNLPMFDVIEELLKRWRDDSSVSFVLLRGSGHRAFCAGGDIRALARPPYPGYPIEFLRKEFVVDHMISCFPKPVVALMNGYTMGGGVGLSVHSQLRVVTDSTRFTMPETGIGLFPDVGSSYFLRRLPGRLGLFIGLTGYRMNAADCLYAGVGTHYVPKQHWSSLIHTLTTMRFPQPHHNTSESSTTTLLPSPNDPFSRSFKAARYYQYPSKPGPPALATTSETARMAVESAVGMYASSHAGKSALRTHRQGIDYCFDTVSDAIPARMAKSGVPFLVKIGSTLHAKCPTSLRITYHLLTSPTPSKDRRPGDLLGSCLRREFRTAVRITAGTRFLRDRVDVAPRQSARWNQHDFTCDFREGVRAQIIDKDRKPRWQTVASWDEVRGLVDAPFLSSVPSLAGSVADPEELFTPGEENL